MSKLTEPAPLAPSRSVIYLGLTGLLAFAFFAFLGIAGANIGIALMLVAALADRSRLLHALRSDPSVLLLAWTALAVGLSVVLRVSRYPEEFASQWNGLLEVMQLFLFLLVAWWLQGRQRLIVLVLFFALIGFTLGVVRSLDAASLGDLLAWRRPHFMWSINAFGQYAAACLIGMALFTPRYRRWLGGKPFWWLGMLGWLTLMGMAGLGVALSLSRGAWLALAAVVLGLVLYLGGLRWRQPRLLRRVVLAGGIGALVVGSILFVSEEVRSRLFDLAQPVAELWSSEGRLEALSDDSDRTRAKLLLLGWETWREAPWFGAGPASPKTIIAERVELFPNGSDYSDFHNVIVDILASLGILGGLPLIATFLLVLRVAHDGYRRGRIDLDLYLVLVSLLTLSAVAQMTDTRILSHHGRYYWMLLAGASYSWWLTASSDRRGNT